MELFNPNIYIDFMRYRVLFVAISCLLVIGAINVWISAGDKKYSIDFLGGHEIQIRFDESIDASKVRSKLSEVGFNDSVVQAFVTGSADDAKDFLIRTASENSSPEEAAARHKATEEKILNSLKELGSFKLLGSDFVGPVIGEQIRKSGLLALAIALLGMLIYITVRFEWSFAVGGIIGILHDVILSAAVVVLSGRDVGVAVLAALLTIIGYSINDSIVVFDRVRENRERARRKELTEATRVFGRQDVSFYELLNLSISQTLSRTTLTGGLTLLMSMTLAIVGTGDFADLAFTFSVGIVIGTYSSVFIASVFALWMNQVSDNKKTKVAVAAR